LIFNSSVSQKPKPKRKGPDPHVEPVFIPDDLKTSVPPSELKRIESFDDSNVQEVYRRPPKEKK
jgi:hypothetical protein